MHTRNITVIGARYKSILSIISVLNYYDNNITKSDNKFAKPIKFFLLFLFTFDLSYIYLKSFISQSILIKAPVCKEFSFV